jgi:hypothetical protein
MKPLALPGGAMLTRLLAVLVAGVAAVAFAADPAPVVTREFKVATVFEQEIDSKKVVDDVEFRYTWQRTGKERALFFREMVSRDKTPEGRAQVHTWTRTGTVTTENGKVTNEVKYDKLPEAQKLARAFFDNPLCKLEVDEAGKVLKRTDANIPDLKRVVEQAVATATLFHPPYYAAKDRWEADGAIGMPNQVDGKLEYTKATGGKGGQLVRVSGTFRSKFPPDEDDKKPKRSHENAKSVITGTQTFDEDRGEWIAGKFDVETSVEISTEFGGMVLQTRKGKLTMTFEMLPDKKK